MRREALVHGPPDDQSGILRPRLTVALVNLLRLAYGGSDLRVPGERQVCGRSKRFAIRLRTQQGRSGGNNGGDDGRGRDRASSRAEGVP